MIVAAYHEKQSIPSRFLRFDFYVRFIWHPVMMSTGMVFLLGLSAVIYRVLTSMSHQHVKLVHAAVHGGGLALALAGLTIAVQFKQELKLPHFTSTHGLFGLITVILFAVQWVISIPVFLWPRAPLAIREPGLGVHVCAGIAVFFSAAVTSFTGLNMKSSDTKSVVTSYYKTAAFFYLFYVLLIFFMVTVKKYERPAALSVNN
uniref:Cytochrome b reductase 1 n=2 Tax=Lygus hesperus TaxID=30085 RepID=A0A0A9X2N9_LYGHE